MFNSKLALFIIGLLLVAVGECLLCAGTVYLYCGLLVDFYKIVFGGFLLTLVGSLFLFAYMCVE
jgi:hypothetical protein